MEKEWVNHVVHGKKMKHIILFGNKLELDSCSKKN